MAVRPTVIDMLTPDERLSPAYYNRQAIRVDCLGNTCE